MSKKELFVIQRKDDKQFWAGLDTWVTEAQEAAKFTSKQDAVTSFWMGNTTDGITLANAVPFYGAH